MKRNAFFFFIAAIVLLGGAHGSAATLPHRSAYEILKLEAGVWDAELTYLDDKGRTVHMRGVQRNALIGDGRWMLNDIYMPGNAPGARRYHGHGVWGYDSSRKLYTGIWVDRNFEAMRSDVGMWDPATSTLYWTGEQFIGEGRVAHFRNVERFAGNKRYFEMYVISARTGKETLLGKLTFTRRAGAADPSAADDTNQLPTLPRGTPS